MELVFDGLGSYATVTPNEHGVLTANNIRAWRMEIKPLLHCGGNELRVVFPPSGRTALRVAQEDPWNAHTHPETKMYVRKAAYEFGWDRGPTFITSDIWRPVRLETRSNARIADVAIHQPDVQKDSAHLIAGASVISTTDTAVTLRLSYRGPNGRQSPPPRTSRRTPTATILLSR